jgi:hypothetical protein
MYGFQEVSTTNAGKFTRWYRLAYHRLQKCNVTVSCVRTQTLHILVRGICWCPCTQYWSCPQARSTRLVEYKTVLDGTTGVMHHSIGNSCPICGGCDSTLSQRDAIT